MKKTVHYASILAVILGILLALGGSGGMWFTYNSIKQENIVTPADASIPNQPVRGPLTLKAQVDIIREHTLESTDGKTFAEMPRQIPKLDESGNQILDDDGNPTMEANTARDIWITATTLTTALHMGILAYALSGLAIFIGLVLIGSGVMMNKLRNRLSS